jgi:hypothetical protein
MSTKYAVFLTSSRHLGDLQRGATGFHGGFVEVCSGNADLEPFARIYDDHEGIQDSFSIGLLGLQVSLHNQNGTWAPTLP